MANPSPGFAKNPGYRIDVTPHEGEVVVTAEGREIARSTRALDLAEAGHPPVIYVPFADIDFTALEPTDTTTRCPFKGEASYWSVKGGPADAMWAYQAPYDEMAAIADHGAFWPGRATVEA
ncbi:MAG: DUF427 domain-containing protein [Rhizobiaceae bacterium]|nr:DUF427 domain-containing protein [Rhizobiaceae bacterium]MCV0408176.1 DUF427 domain-containing protein [Rhizobiaceae bacterium]